MTILERCIRSLALAVNVDPDRTTFCPVTHELVEQGKGEWSPNPLWVKLTPRDDGLVDITFAQGERPA